MVSSRKATALLACLAALFGLALAGCASQPASSSSRSYSSESAAATPAQNTVSNAENAASKMNDRAKAMENLSPEDLANGNKPSGN